MASRIVDILTVAALDQTYSYRVPAGMEIAPGDVVSVPLGARETLALVWAENANPDPRLHNRLKDISDKLDLPPMSAPMRQFIAWMANYTLTPRGTVLRMALRINEQLGPERLRIGVRRAGPEPARMTPARQRVLDLLADGLLRAKADAAEEAGVSIGVIDGLIDAGTLLAQPLPADKVAENPDPDFCAPELSAAQAREAEHLRAMVHAREFAVALMDGVTGSGKTEVYFEALAQALRDGRQVLIMMPEIALTSQFRDRFAARFGVLPAEWHSELTPRKRARTWRAVANGEVRVVVGARSALFLPFDALGLIVIDEEHDQSYKQEEGVRYHTRDMAIVRAKLVGLPVILSSATPSVESEVNARRGRYRRVALPARFGGQAMPHVETIDLRAASPPRGRFIAPVLVEEIAGAIARGEQSLLFVNRRGYAPLTLCRACGYRFNCSACDAWLVDHRFRQRLVCHHCGFSMPRPHVCPQCAGEDTLIACGPGVERLQEEVSALFPDARTMVLSSDMAASVEKMREELADITEGRVDIVVGTQLVAKGHHFPRLNLVGVVDADLGLGNGDPRAAERTFQLLHQVVGRAGREAGQGRGFLQTHQPVHPVMRALASGDRAAFYTSEIAARERTAYPPFGRLASIIVSTDDRAAAEGFARALAQCAPREGEVQVLGPAEAPLSLVRGRYRYRLLVKAPKNFDLSSWLRAWLARGPRPKGKLRCDVDVDPQSFL